MSSDFTHNSSGDDFSDLRRRNVFREEEDYAPSTQAVIRHRIKQTCERYLFQPLTYETMDCMRLEIIQLLRRYVSFGELPDFRDDEILVFTDPSDPHRLLVKIGKDGCHDPFRDMMEVGRET